MSLFGAYAELEVFFCDTVPILEIELVKVGDRLQLGVD